MVIRCFDIGNSCIGSGDSCLKEVLYCVRCFGVCSLSDLVFCSRLILFCMCSGVCICDGDLGVPSYVTSSLLWYPIGPHSLFRRRL